MWQRDPNPYNYQAFYNQCRYVNNLTNNLKRSYYGDKIHESKGNLKRIFGIINTLLQWDEVFLLPPSEDPKQLANDFNVFFKTKIYTIMEGLRDSLKGLVNAHYIEKIHQTNCQMEKFSCVDVDLITRLVWKSAFRSYSLDPIPTELLKLHIDVLALVLCDLVNTSLTNGEVSEGLKEAKLRPLLKKSGLDTTFKNHRPMSNLSFVSKLMKKVVCEQLTRYTHSTGKTEPLQSSYKVDHSTEMALLRVKLNIIKNMDQNKIKCLILLDLGTAFDTFDHELLFNHLNYIYGVTGQVLEWIHSYLTGRTQSVVIGDPSSGGAESEKNPTCPGDSARLSFGPYLIHTVCLTTW